MTYDIKILLHLEKYNKNGCNHDQSHRYHRGDVILKSEKYQHSNSKNLEFLSLLGFLFGASCLFNFPC